MTVDMITQADRDARIREIGDRADDGGPVGLRDARWLLAETDRLYAERSRLTSLYENALRDLRAAQAETRRIVTGAGCTCGWNDSNPHEAYCPCSRRSPAGSAGAAEYAVADMLFTEETGT